MDSTANLDVPPESDRMRHDLFKLALPVLVQHLLIFFVGFYDVYLAGMLGNLSVETKQDTI